MLAQARECYGDGVEIVIAGSRTEAAEIGHHPAKAVLYRDPDVLDTWFSSALWPFGTLGWTDETETLKRHYPNELLISGRSEEHTSELQTLMRSSYVVFCLNKKKKQQKE